MSPLLFLHIAGGTVGLISGFIAVFLRKGSGGHRIAGNVFFVSMLTMAGLGAFLALLKSQTGNVFGGITTFYLVATGWATVRSPNGRMGRFDWVALLFILGAGTGMLAGGIEALQAPKPIKGGVPVGMYFFFAFLAFMSAAGDIRMLIRGGVFGVRRIARHVWRMCFGLFAASASVFLARAHLFPAILRSTHVLTFLSFLPLALMIFWLIRIRVVPRRRAYRPPPNTLTEALQ